MVMLPCREQQAAAYICFGYPLVFKLPSRVPAGCSAAAPISITSFLSSFLRTSRVSVVFISRSIKMLIFNTPFCFAQFSVDFLNLFYTLIRPIGDTSITVF